MGSCLLTIVFLLSGFLAHEPAEALGQPIQAGNQLPEGLPDYVQASLKQASAQAKPILLDIGAKWCGPCRMMEKKVLPHPLVADELQHWVLVKVDQDDYPQLAKSFEIRGLPAYIVIEDGRIKNKLHGYQIPHDFADWLTEAREKP